MLINAVIQKDENGYFAFVPELKGCVSEGASFEEARANIKEAIKLYLESLETDVIHRIVAKEAEALLLQNGFVVDRQSGSHRIQKRIETNGFATP